MGRIIVPLIWFLIACQEDAATNKNLVIESPEEDSTTDVSIETPSVKSTVLSAKVAKNQGLHQVMEGLHIPDNLIRELTNSLRFDVDISTLKVGQELRTEWLPDSSRVKWLEFRPNLITIHRLDWSVDSNKYLLSTQEKPVDRKYRMVEGMLKSGSTVDGILKANNIPNYLVQTVNGVLLCKINFRSEAQPGDKFKALLEEDYFEGEVVRGKVLYTSYEGRVAGFHEAYRYEDLEDPKSSFNAHYTPDGEALVSSGLRYPVDRLHISSNYGWRRHPVTGGRKMHYGVDYAARTGTPVYSVSSGVVVTSAYDQYSGNKVAIRHADRSTSYYLHLNKRMVRKGQEVRSRQIIGQVGATGRVTGPHLHFGFKKPNGEWMNPLRKRMIATPKLMGKRLQELNTQMGNIQNQKSHAQKVTAQHPLPHWPKEIPFLWMEAEEG